MMLQETIRQRFSSSRLLLAGLSLILALMLDACGDTPAPAPATSTPPSPTSIVKGDGDLPAVSGTQEITVDQGLSQEVFRQLKGVGNPSFKVFGSDESDLKLAADYDKALKSANFEAVFPTSKEKEVTSTLYSGPGGIDLLLTVFPVPADENQLLAKLNIPGLSEALAAKLLGQIKGKKSVAVLVSGIGLAKAILSPFAPTESPLTPSVATEPVVEGPSLHAYANATLLNLSEATQKRLLISPLNTSGDVSWATTSYLTFTSSDSVDKVAAYYSKVWQEQGYSLASNMRLTSSPILLRNTYQKVGKRAKVLATGPLTKFDIGDFTSQNPELADKIKVGDILVIIAVEQQ